MSFVFPICDFNMCDVFSVIAPESDSIMCNGISDMPNHVLHALIGFFYAANVCIGNSPFVR